MSNVVKLKKKKLEIDKWAEITNEHGEKLLGRLYDQVKIADVDAIEEGIPEEISDCMIIGVITSLIVTSRLAMTHARDVITPEALLKLVAHEIEQRVDE
jgi:cobalamin biosynthesis Co2+ chelatase CbiK